MESDTVKQFPTRAEEFLREALMATTAVESKQNLVADGLVSLGEAAEFLGVSRSTLYVLMDNGCLKYCKIGGARRIPRRALVELAERSLRGGPVAGAVGVTKPQRK